MSESKRRHQNKIAQRKFRQKQAEQAEQAKIEFEDLKSRFEALVSEHESLKRTPVEQQVVPVSTSNSPDNVQFADLGEALEQELLLLESPDSYSLFATENDGIALDAGNFGQRLDSLSPFLASPDFALPSIELEPPVSNGDYSAATATKAFTGTLRSGVEVLPSASASPSKAVACLAPSGDVHAYQNAALQAPVMSVDAFDANFDFGGGFHPSPSYYPTAPDVVQAIVQVMHVQERIALIDLEKTKLQVCRC
jgi:hypothetical protein